MWIQQTASSKGPRASRARASSSPRASRPGSRRDGRDALATDVARTFVRPASAARERRDPVAAAARASVASASIPVPPTTSAWPGRSRAASDSRGVGVEEQLLGQRHGRRVDPAERQLARSYALLQHREKPARVRAGQGDPVGGHGTCFTERAERARCDERHVDRQHHDDVVQGMPESCDHAVHGRPRVGPVVDDRERQPVAHLADDEHLVACLPQEPRGALRERLTAKAGERLRRAVPLRGATDDQYAGKGHVPQCHKRLAGRPARAFQERFAAARCRRSRGRCGRSRRASRRGR